MPQPNRRQAPQIHDLAFAEFARLQGYTGATQPLQVEIYRSAFALLQAELGWYLTVDSAGNTALEQMLPENIDTQPILLHQVESLAKQALIQRIATTTVEGNSQRQLLAMRLSSAVAQQQRSVAIYLLPYDTAEEQPTRHWIVGLLLQLLPLQKKSQPMPLEATESQQTLLATLLQHIASSSHVDAAMLRICNDLASRYQCERVSIGWYYRDRLEIRSQSHIQDLNQQTEAVEALIAVMQECAAYRDTIHYSDEMATSYPSHDFYTHNYQSAVLLSLPIRQGETVLGVMVLERRLSFREEDTLALQAVVDLSSGYLQLLEQQSRSLPRRLHSALLQWLQPADQRQQRGRLLTAITILALILLLATPWWPYRIDAPTLLRTDEQNVVAAPYDGFIDTVAVAIGDRVEQGDLLVTLDTRSLQLQEAEALSEVVQYGREAEKADVAYALADKRIALARRAQKQAVLDSVRYQLQQARIVAPMDGIVVEGDQKNRQGAPIRKGELLFRISKLDNLYAELEVDEQDIQEVAIGANGAISFIAAPQQTFSLQVRSIDPLVIAKDTRAVITVRAELTSKESWWRPGMTGVAKIETGRRTPLWVLLHNTIDYLRIAFWL